MPPERQPNRTLYVLRHAKSAWPPGVADHLRPLNPRGRRDAPAAGRWLAAQPGIDQAVVSPAVRTRETWQLVSAQLPAPVPVSFDDRVYAASSATLLDVVRGIREDATTAILVGHNPGCEDLALQLAGPGSALDAVASVGRKYPTSGLAVLHVAGAWSQTGAATTRLVDFVVPRGTGDADGPNPAGR